MLCFGPEAQVVSEAMKQRRSRYEHFASHGSARAAIRARLLTKEFPTKAELRSEIVTFSDSDLC